MIFAWNLPLSHSGIIVNWRELNDNLLTHRIFTLIMNGVFIQALKVRRTVTMEIVWIANCLSLRAGSHGHPSPKSQFT